MPIINLKKKINKAYENSKEIFHNAKLEGYGIGYKDGKKEGYNDGYEIGYKEGKEASEKLIEEALEIKKISISKLETRF